jgi:hypothetical protein
MVTISVDSSLPGKELSTGIVTIIYVNIVPVAKNNVNLFFLLKINLKCPSSWAEGLCSELKSEDHNSFIHTLKTDLTEAVIELVHYQSQNDKMYIKLERNFITAYNKGTNIRIFPYLH